VIGTAGGGHRDVDRGAETSRTAALLVYKDGLEAADAAAFIYDTPRAPNCIAGKIDKETSRVDPAWREYDQKIFAGIWSVPIGCGN